MSFKKKIFCSKKELKYELINRLVDENGNKVSKGELSKDKNFLKAIKFNGNSMSTGTISNYCKILCDIEPLGIIDEKFLYDYHQNETNRIDINTTFSSFSKNKKTGGKGFRSERDVLMSIIRGEMEDFNLKIFKNESNSYIKDFLLILYTEEELSELLDKYGNI